MDKIKTRITLDNIIDKEKPLLTNSDEYLLQMYIAEYNQGVRTYESTLVSIGTHLIQLKKQKPSLKYNPQS